MKAPILFGTVLMMGAAAASAKSAHVAKKKDVHVAKPSLSEATKKQLALHLEDALRLRQAMTHAEPVPEVTVAPATVPAVVAVTPTEKKDTKDVVAVKADKEPSRAAEASVSPALRTLPALVRVSASNKEVVPATASGAASEVSTPANHSAPKNVVPTPANGLAKTVPPPKCVTRYSVAFGTDKEPVPVNVCGDKLGKITQKLLRAEGSQGHTLDSALALRLSQMLPADKAKNVRFDVLADSKAERSKSAHTDGRAIDIKPTGVSLKALAEACKKLEDTGCGAYPEGGFLHVDLRDAGAGNVSWVDASRPGEAPKYVAEWPKTR